MGNSSSALREGSYLGVPAVNIGTRQNGRERGKNVLNVGYNSKKLRQLLFQELNQKNLRVKKFMEMVMLEKELQKFYPK